MATITKKKIAYWTFLGLFSLMILGSVWNYMFNFEATLNEFAKLGYPTHLVHPLVVCQIIGLVVLISNKGKWLIEWTYAGFFFNLAFAVMAHYMTKEGNGAAAVIGLIILFATYILNKELKYDREQEMATS
ncbi:MAG: DoxX family protein [Flavobacteriaceae bacterium]